MPSATDGKFNFCFGRNLRYTILQMISAIKSHSPPPKSGVEMNPHRLKARRLQFLQRFEFTLQQVLSKFSISLIDRDPDSVLIKVGGAFCLRMRLKSLGAYIGLIYSLISALQQLLYSIYAFWYICISLPT